MDDLIKVGLTDQDKAEIRAHGRIRLYGFDWIEPDLPGRGRSVLPPELVGLFCDDEERKNYPQFYNVMLRENDPWDAPGEWVYSTKGLDRFFQLRTLRYVPGYWSVSDGDWLHVFAHKNACLKFLLSYKNFGTFSVRSPSGKHLKIKITLNLI